MAPSEAGRRSYEAQIKWLSCYEDQELAEGVDGYFLDKAEVLPIACAADAELAAKDAEIANLRLWRDAVIDACVVDWILVKEHESDPRRAVNDLLCWQQKIALDPAVSKDAYDMVQRADAAEAALATLRAQATALANEWESDAKELDEVTDGTWIEPGIRIECAIDLRELLAASDPGKE